MLFESIFLKLQYIYTEWIFIKWTPSKLEFIFTVDLKSEPGRWVCRYESTCILVIVIYMPIKSAWLKYDILIVIYKCGVL